MKFINNYNLGGQNNSTLSRMLALQVANLHLIPVPYTFLQILPGMISLVQSQVLALCTARYGPKNKPRIPEVFLLFKLATIKIYLKELRLLWKFNETQVISWNIDLPFGDNILSFQLLESVQFQFWPLCPLNEIKSSFN